MYEIKIIDQTGEHALEIMEDSFPITMESGSIADLTDRSASWSYEIDLPKSSNNLQVLGFAGTPFVINGGEYKRYLCNVYCNGLLIVRKGVLFIITTTDESITIQIMSGVADIFERMKDIAFDKTDEAKDKMAHNCTLPLSTFIEITTASGVNIRYPRSIVVCNDDITIKEDSKKNALYEYATPIVQVGAQNSNGLLSKLLSKLGYTLVTNTPSEKLNNLFMALADRKGENGVVFTRTIYSPMTETDRTGMLTGIRSNVYKSKVKVELTPELKYRHADETLMTAYEIWQQFFVANGIIIYNEVDPSDTTSGIQPSDTPLLEPLKVTIDRHNWEAYVGTDGVLTYTFEHDMAHDKVLAYYEMSGVLWGEATGGRYYKVDLAEGKTTTTIYSDGDFVHAGGTIVLEQNLGVANALDFFKIVAQVFGWIIKVDGVNKTIYAYTFDKVVQNVSNAIDWSDKLIKGYEMTFTFGDYAQKNNISFEDNDNINFKDEYSFYIDENKQLDGEADVLNIAVSSGKGNVIDWWNKDDNEFKFKSIKKPRLIVQDESTGEYSTYTSMNVFMNYYKFIQTIQYGIRVVNAQLLLNEIDIHNFDEFTPIYLRQFGAYFYVNKIEEWEAGRACHVELLQIHT